MRRYFDSNPVRLKPRIQNRKGENTSTNIIRQDRTVLIQNQHVFNNVSPRRINHAAKIPGKEKIHRNTCSHFAVWQFRSNLGRNTVCIMNNHPDKLDNFDKFWPTLCGGGES